VAEPGAAPPAEEETLPPETEDDAGEEDARDEEEFLEEIEALISSDDEDEDEETPSTDDRPAVTDDDLDDYALPDPDSVFRVEDDPEPRDRPATDPFVGDDEEVAERTSPEAPPAGGEYEPRMAMGAVADEHVPRRGEDAVADAEHADGMPAFVAEEQRGRLWPRILLPLVALALLGGTWIHVQRGKLLRLPAGEAVLGPIYRVLGVTAAPDWRPGDFRVVRSEAIADPDRPGELQVAVEFMNAAEFAQPYPLIRIVLQDRFGQRIATHDFAPDAYLETYKSGARLQADGRIRAAVAAPDPGGRADGFRVDLCLELDARGIVCSGEPFR
jgi:hypothetical protein